MSGIQSLDAFVADRKLAKTQPLAALADSTLGIDADWFVTQALGGVPNGPANKREPLLQAVGGFPASLEASLTALVGALKTQKITPLVVIQGLHSSLTVPPLVPQSGSRRGDPLEQRNRAWGLYDEGKGEQAVRVFDETTPFGLHDVAAGASGLHHFVSLLISLKIDYIIAPYSASAQLAYLYQESYVDAIYGSDEVLLFRAIDTLVTAVDVKASTYQWIAKRAVLSDLGFSQEQFVEAALAVGCPLNGNVMFQQIDVLAAGNRTLPIAVAQELIRGSRSLYGVIMGSEPLPVNAVPSQPSTFPERFQMALASLEFQPVLKDTGKVEPFQNVGPVPNDVHDFIGQRLPDELYFYLSRGLLSAELLNARTSGLFLEYPPLDGGDCREYREFLTQLNRARTKSVAILVGTLNRYYQFTPISVRMWFDPTRDIKLDRVNPPLYPKTVGTWFVTDATLNSVGVNSSTTNKLLKTLLTALAKNPAKFAPHSGPRPVFKTPREIVGNAALSALQLVGLISDSHELTKWGQALASGLSAVGSDDDWTQQLLVATLLAMQGNLNSRDFTPAYGGPGRGTPEEQAHIRLISRVATHVNLRHKSIGYTGPLSRSLLAYHSIMAKQTQALRWLLEASLMANLTNGSVDRVSYSSDADWAQLVSAMPFGSVPNAGAGIATKSFLEELLVRSAAEASNSIDDMFKQAVDVSGDVKSALTLWRTLEGIVKASGEGKPDFAAAGAWLKSTT